MPITLLIRSEEDGPGSAPPALTFDGPRIVIGRGPGCDVRLPDPSVTLRHASIRADVAEYAIYDEGSTNGTYVGGVRLAPNTPHVLRDGDLVRCGRVWLEVSLGKAAATQELALATRELALQLVSRAMRGLGDDVTPKVRVVEGRDAGFTVVLADEGRVYTIGRASECDVPLMDAEASREHAHLVRRGSVVLVRDLGSKNGVLAGGVRLPEGRDVPWRSGVILRIGMTGLALEEPVVVALAELEAAEDEIVRPDEAPPAPTPISARGPVAEGADRSVPATLASAGAHPGSSEMRAAPVLPSLSSSSPPRGGDSSGSLAGSSASRLARGAGWSPVDMAVMTTAVVILALSVAGLVWLFRG